MSIRNLIRCALQDVKYNRNTVLILIGTVPFFLVMSVLPLTSNTFGTWSSLHEFILSFRFEFFYSPLFILLLGSLTNLNDWILVRKYDRREHIAVYDIVLVLVTAAIFTFIVFGFGFLIYAVIKFLIYPRFPGYSAIFHYHPEQIEYPAVSLFILLFYLMLSLIGLFFVLLNGVTKQNILAASLVIVLIVIDRFSLSIIPIIFTFGYFNFPFQCISVLLLFIFLLSILARVQLKNKDFLQ